MSRPALAALAALALLVLLAAPPAAAQGAGPFSRMGMGARSLAFPAQVADLSGYGSPYLNPALAPFQPSQAVELSAGILRFDREWQAVQVGSPLRPRSGFAGGVVHGGVSNIDGRDASGQPIDAPTADGTYASDEYAFFVAFGTRFSDAVSAGLGLRLYRTQLLEGVRAPTAIGVSAGVTARPSERLALGLAVDDLFARYEWNESGPVSASATDYFPVRVRGGAAYGLGSRGDGRPRATVSAEVEVSVQPAESVRPAPAGVTDLSVTERTETLDYRLADVVGRAGGEVWITDEFAVRAGVDRVGAGEAGELRPGAGFGLQQRFGELDARIDYAAVLEPFGTGLMHMATVRLGL
ncbi:hypothetical protein RQM47_06020 [Rubrivirga sp. S365]|uniref:hypothetical protein n=1 Tax=Rubrivirga sp. S365 TaxID=3076080 RepID=UPI0028CA0582|nr:hypothetical protein [Rubrivirga sp. S365]MDT7856188.1 hypothetical protein [Rubrivirga sp. S365]